MTAEQVKEALRGRHPASQRMGYRTIPGPWTTVEEWLGIDLLAVSAHRNPQQGAVPGVSYPRVGYEVKVSRGDYRRELLRPNKRLAQVQWCNAFYFAVPRGLLTAEEIAFEEPKWEPTDWYGEPCPGAGGRRCSPTPGRRTYRLLVPVPSTSGWGAWDLVVCPVCHGRGTVSASRVECEAPTLWVPRDVGLIEVDGCGCRVAKPSPVRKQVSGVDSGRELAVLLRWVSVRPDPRHASYRAVEDFAAEAR